MGSASPFSAVVVVVACDLRLVVAFVSGVPDIVSPASPPLFLHPFFLLHSLDFVAGRLTRRSFGSLPERPLK